MDLSTLLFRRKFSFNIRKNDGIPIGKMTFNKDFLNTGNRGDLYPVIAEGGATSDSAIAERIENGKFRVETCVDSYRVRLICEYFPFATCEATVAEQISGEFGFAFNFPNRLVAVCIRKDADGSTLILHDGDGREEVAVNTSLDPGDGFVVSSRRGAVDVFIRKDGYCKLLHTFKPHDYDFTVQTEIVNQTKIALYENGYFTLSDVTVSLDNGISHADIRPIKNEVGEILLENGRIFLTASIRTVELKYQGIFSWLPGTTDLKMEGAIFFDVGDGIIGDDVASSIVYDRREGVFHIWYCSFSHGHVLSYVRAEGEVRYGINILDATLLTPLLPGDPDTAFLGKEGDEDPDLTYDPVSRKWYLTVCRLVKTDDGMKYRYFLFSSDRPDGGFLFVARSESGDETGGNMVRLGERLAFVCGSGFDKRAEYHIYDLPDFSNLRLAKFDYDDGGFRGWGTVLPIKLGTRTRCFWLTFDRHLASHFNWSYGNIYCFEADMRSYKDQKHS